MLRSSFYSIAALILSLAYQNVMGTFVLPPKEYWQVSPPLNYSDVLYAGWEQINVQTEVEVYNGVDIGRTVRAILHCANSD